MTDFSETYVKIAEATAASRDALTNAVEPLSDTANYLSTGLAGNVKVVVDVQTSGTWDEVSAQISPTQFEVDNLIPANSAWTQVNDLSLSNSAYLGLVTSINNYVVSYVLGSDKASGGTYGATLQIFLDTDCTWDADPSAGAGAPTAWIELMQAAGFSVVDTHPDNA